MRLQFLIQIALSIGALTTVIDNARAQEVSTSIWEAAASGDIPRLKKLVEIDGISVDAGDDFGNTPLHYASWNGKVEAIIWLIDQGTEVNKYNYSNWSPLHWGTRNGQLSAIDLLIENNAEVDAPGHLDQTALHLAVKYEYREIISRLLKANANPNTEDSLGQTPMHLAALDGFTSIVLELLDNGGNIDSKSEWGATPLSAAAARGRTSTVNALLLRGAQVDPKTSAGWTPLFSSVVGKFSESAKLLRENGANIHIKTKTNNTLLHAAASSGMDDLVKLLLEAGLEINTEDSGGQTPLDQATANKWKKTIELLKLNGGTFGSKKTLHQAALIGELEEVKRLIFNGAAISQYDDWHLPPRNWTPLHYAAAGGNLSVIVYLIQSGADVLATDHSNWTPMIIALANQNIEAANLLKRWQSLGISNIGSRAVLVYSGKMSFDVFGLSGSRCLIETSTDLKKWSPLSWISLVNGKARFNDPRKILLPRCFYRAKVLE